MGAEIFVQCRLTQVQNIIVYHFGVSLLYTGPSLSMTIPKTTNTAARRGVGPIIVQVILNGRLV